MRNVIVVGIIACCFLGGCASKYEGKTDYQLCYSKATQAKIGPAKRVRQAEIDSRGLNCKKYANRINRDVAAERNARASAPSVSTVIKNEPFKPIEPRRVTHCSVIGNSVTCF